MNKEFHRIQKLAGLTEGLLNEAEDISQEIQVLVDKNEFLKGNPKELNQKVHNAFSKKHLQNTTIIRVHFNFLSFRKSIRCPLAS